jgi:hypothetical protein
MVESTHLKVEKTERIWGKPQVVAMSSVAR